MGGRFEGKVVIVTGAASGIGRAAALRVAAEGGRVLAVDLADPGPTAAEAPDAITALRGDAADEEFVADCVARATEAHGRLDAVFANAGIGGGLARLHEAGVDEWNAVLRINLVGVFLAIREGSRAMVAAGHGGSIVATASVAGLRSGAGGMAYSAAKAGVVNLVMTSANQLAGTGIRVNAICPGLTETGMTQAMFDGARARGNEAKLGQINPLRRGARAEEAAAVACFLLSDDASYVNGQAIAVDGGLSSSHPTVRPNWMI